MSKIGKYSLRWALYVSQGFKFLKSGFEHDRRIIMGCSAGKSTEFTVGTYDSVAWNQQRRHVVSHG